MKLFQFAGCALLGSLLAFSGCGETDLLSLRDTTLVGDTANVAGPYVIETFATDETEVKRVKLHYAVNGAPGVAVEMAQVGDGHYRGASPGQPVGTRVTYWVDAKDVDGNRVNDPPAAPERQYAFSVTEERLVGPDGTGGGDGTTFPEVDVEIPRIPPPDRSDGSGVGSGETPVPGSCAVTFLFPTEGLNLGPANDFDPVAPGLQVDVTVQVSGLTPGALASLTLSSGLQVGVDPTSSRIIFDNVTLLDGETTLTVEVVRDADLLPGCTGSVTVTTAASEPDTDGDAVADRDDNCVTVANTNQTDADRDGAGDACDDDIDGDGIANGRDNCPLVSNASQADTDRNGVGDACSDDRDGDGVPDARDNCPDVANRDQTATQHCQWHSHENHTGTSYCPWFQGSGQV